MQKLKLALAAAGLALASSSANAALVSVTAQGATVNFSYQYDDALVNLFTPGSYTIVGDTLSFSPTNLRPIKTALQVGILLLPLHHWSP